MRRKPLVILLLAVLCLIFIIASSGCGKIKKITQGISGPSGPGQHVDIGYGWDQGIDGGWQEDLSTPISSGWALPKVNIDPYVNLMAGNKILYQYNLSPIEQENKGLVALRMSSVIKVIELELLPSIQGIDDVYVYDRISGIVTIPMPGVVCTDKSDLDAGYIRFELNIPDSAGNSLVLHDGFAALVLSR